MKYILLILSTLILSSCKIIYNEYTYGNGALKTYYDIYDDSYTTEQVISKVEYDEPVNIYFNYQYPYYWSPFSNIQRGDSSQIQKNNKPKR